MPEHCARFYDDRKDSDFDQSLKVIFFNDAGLLNDGMIYKWRIRSEENALLSGESCGTSETQHRTGDTTALKHVYVLLALRPAE